MNTLLLSLHRRSRQKKHELFARLLRPAAGMRILNVGASGTQIGLSEQLETFWPQHDRITGGGLSFADVQDYARCFPRAAAVVFDGCALPFADKSFDIVFSNAVIEHLPSWSAQQQFAAEVQRVGRGWFVTTPNLWFPVEPHYHLPFVQFCSEDFQKRLVVKLGRVPYPSLKLLTKRQMRGLFTAGDVIGCRVTFYPETLIAYKAP